MTNNIMNCAKIVATVLVSTATPIGAFAQTPTSIKGTVVDQEGIPVIGANVVQKGTSNGVITDFDGKFVLRAPSDATLVISYIGYTPQEVKATQNLHVILQTDQIFLDEAVVIGYGSVKKSDATGSVTAIKPDKMNRGQTTNAQDLLSGKVAGVSVTNAGGTPGSGATIRIRGGSSLNASNDPLIVIDGLPMDNNGIQGVANPLSTINPNDIESFTVLKDASATAIYGSRASNGVIIITTKKGQAGSRPVVSYDGNVSVSTRMDEIQMMDSTQFRAFVTDLYTDDKAAEKFATLGNADTDWQDQIFQSGIGTDHAITVTGGLKNMPYRASFGYTNQEGILKTSKMERFTGSVNLSPSFFDDHLKVNLNAKGMYIKNRYANTGAVGAALWMDPTQPVMGNSENPDYEKFGGYFQWYQKDEAGKILPNSLAPKNPLAMLELKDDQAKSKSFLGNAQFDYKFHFLPELRANLNLAMDYSQGRQDTWVSQYMPENNLYGNDGYSDQKKTNKNLDFYFQYGTTKGRHAFDVMAGYAWQHFYREGNSFFADIIENDEADYSRVWKTESYLVSFFGRVNYTFNDKYLATVTVREDGTSRFSADNRWSTFPSLALGWKMSEEDCFKQFKNLSDLKLRAGYGITGQQEFGTSDYPYIGVYTDNFEGAYFPVYNPDGSVKEWVETSRPEAYNEDLKWEQTTTWNVGLDFGFYKNRISGSIDAYYRKTDDLLAVVDVPLGMNFSNQLLRNIGSLENKGVEISLNTTPIQTDDWHWELNVNATYNDNKITKLASVTNDANTLIHVGGISTGTGSTIQAHQVGQPAYSFYVYEQVYDDQGAPIEGMFVDRNGDGVINDSDRYFNGSPAAKWQMGLNTKLTYKNWDLGISMRANFGNKVYNDVLASRSDVDNFYANAGYWTNAPVDAVSLGFQGVPNWYYSDYFVENASFLRIDNITLGYTMKNLFNSGLYGRIYATVSNPCVFSSYSGLDPEVYSGIDNVIYPRPMVSLIGLSLTF